MKIKPRGKNAFHVLKGGEHIPVGSVNDTRTGRIQIVVAASKSGKTWTAVFYAGPFKLTRTKGKTPTTVLTLTEKLTGCGDASTAAKRNKKRRLWGDGKGRFQTTGKRSAATVVGTKRLVEDRCTPTLTRWRGARSACATSSRRRRCSSRRAGGTSRGRGDRTPCPSVQAHLT